MTSSRTRIIATAAVLGGFIGLLIGLVASQSVDEALEQQHGEESAIVAFRPSVREWIGLTVTVVTLLRQIANILTSPESQS